MSDSGFGGDQPAEHQRFACHLQALAIVRDEDEADLVTAVLRDPDTTMAQSAVVRHLDRRAGQLLTDERFTHWAHAMATVVHEREFLTRRLHEWTLLRSTTPHESWTTEEVATASEWFQRKAAETVTSPAVLTLLATTGRTRRVRVTASRRLQPRDQQPS
ncbi:hypothetical protein ACIHCQ_10955 [Streptomyces sp. NPDC052236]|uniref:hypothetical protein n=1 Tax=Streptomyces sp. NPDC052236 TaxID=3365686 RepID=UPI0037D03252